MADRDLEIRLHHVTIDEYGSALFGYSRGNQIVKRTVIVDTNTVEHIDTDLL